MRSPSLPIVVALLALQSLACTWVKYCFQTDIQIGIEGKSCLCSPDMANCNVDCGGEPCETFCDNKNDCNVDCVDNDYCEVSGRSESVFIDCGGSAFCDVSCEQSSSCEVDCTDGNCIVTCNEGDCTVRNCDLASEDCVVECGMLGPSARQEGDDAVCG
ncbi:MAG: hypothetical protein V4850_28955 [Myxococcota bacterium]